MVLFASRKEIIYRLCFIFLVNLDIFFPVVLSNTLQIESKKSNDYVNLSTDNPLRISLKNFNFNSSKNRSQLVKDEVIENMDILSPLKTVPLVITDIPPEIYFIITEVHTFLHDVTLGYQPNKLDYHSYITGTNIGLVNMTDEPVLSNVTLYLENVNPFNVTVLIAVTAHNKSVPIPGGCNMEFQTEIAPYLLLSYTDSIITVSNQPAAMPPTFVNKRKSCQIPPGTLLHYEMYHMYLPEGDFTEETYFDSIRSMITVDRIIQNGRKVPPTLIGPINKRLFSAYIGTGSVYAIVVYTLSSSDIYNNLVFSSAAYIPAMTYACSPEISHYNCQIFKSAFFDVIFICLLLLGIFLTIFGHVYFKTELFIFGACTFGIITYLLLIVFASFTQTVTAGLSVLSSLIGGMLWVQIWCYFGVPILAILLPLLNAGFLASSSLFHFFGYSPAMQPIMQSDANFWLALVCGSLSITLLLITKAQDASVLSNAFIGSYMITLALDYFIGSNLKYIIINIYRRVTIREFTGAFLDPPFQILDFILWFIWSALVITGYFTQKTLLSGKPPFPPPSSHRRLNRRDYWLIPNPGDSEESGEYADDCERTPILANPHQH